MEWTKKTIATQQEFTGEGSGDGSENSSFHNKLGFISFREKARVVG